MGTSAFISAIKLLISANGIKLGDSALKYFDQNPIGMLVTRSVSDMETIAEIFSQGILVIIGDLLKLFGVLIFMFYINWKLTLLVLIPIPLLIVSTNIFKRAIKNSFQEVRKQVSTLNSFVQEHISHDVKNLFQ